MYIIHKGKKLRFLGGYVGENKVTEIWRGGVQIWPNAEGEAKSIHLRLPQKGTREWQYWVHALDATSMSASPDNYMRIKCDDLYYYIQNSADGSEPYKIEGSYLVLTYGDGIPIDKIGAYIEIEANIKSRNGKEIYFTDTDYIQTFSWAMPLLEGTKIQSFAAPLDKYGYILNYSNLTSLPSGTKWPDTATDNSRLFYPATSQKILEKEIPESDDSVSVDAQIGNVWKGTNKYWPVWPSFRKVFKLEVYSVD